MRESERGFYVLAVLIGVYLDGAVVPAHNELSYPIARDVEVVQTLDRPVLPLAFHRPLHLWALPNETRRACTSDGRGLEELRDPARLMQPFLNLFNT